ncbi:GNAT family N-acetyltransferase [Nocardia noduli]|uniref:GNAT family N-acetyltransferase n=1 Tax=Nocardia noduli TaxID=2815722 RepID=UPI0020B3FE62|nr:GNAT family N-acetyltransferase [Nocardia noduli]
MSSDAEHRLRITVDDLTGPEIAALLGAHLAEMHVHSPDDSSHALDIAALRDPAVTFWSVWDRRELVGCGALKELDPEHGEIKSMRTVATHAGRGIATTLLTHIVEVARTRGYRRLSLETGAAEFYLRAIDLYRRHGFARCPPFGEYEPSPHSVFMTRTL